MNFRRYGAWMQRAFRAAPSRVFYHVCRLLPRDRRLAVYAAYWYRGYSCNPAAVYEKARELAPSVRGVWVVDREHRDSVPAGLPIVVEGSLAYFRALARATWFVNNVNFPDFVVKRRGAIVVQTHHGTPVKVMGLEVANYPPDRRLDVAAIRRRCSQWDYSITANEHSTRCWRRSYPGDYEILEYGYPRNDRLAVPDSAAVAAIRTQLGVAPHQTVVLYAPTQRSQGKGYRPLLDIETVADALGPEFVLLRRAHYYYEGLRGPRHPRVHEVTDYAPVEDLLLASDMLITDYSSIMFDYAVLDRPIVLYVPDWDWYRTNRGVTFDLLAEPPGVVTTTQQELIDALTTGTATSEAAEKLRDVFRRRFSYLDDGNAAERVVRKVFNQFVVR
jgi:CDP-glycerol glycerophosphotransferase